MKYITKTYITPRSVGKDRQKVLEKGAMQAPKEKQWVAGLDVGLVLRVLHSLQWAEGTNTFNQCPHRSGSDSVRCDKTISASNFQMGMRRNTADPSNTL